MGDGFGERAVDLFLAGAQKSGTSALYHRLAQTPGVVMSRMKEPHFFDDERHDWSSPDYAPLRECFDPGPGIRGEATPIYSYWPNSLERIHEHNPLARLLLVLRHPADRAHSHWRMERARGQEPLGFSDAIRAGRERVAASPGGAHRVHSYVERGFYADQVGRAHGLFGAGQVLVLTTDELWQEPASAMEALSAFLGVKVDPSGLGYRISASGGPEVAMAAEDREYLYEVFAAEFEALAAVSRGVSLAWADPAYRDPVIRP